MGTPVSRVICNDPQLADSLRGLLPITEVLCQPADCSQAPPCCWANDEPLARLRAALVDTVGTLKLTRHAFRCREPGALRRLQQTLEELPLPGE